MQVLVHLASHPNEVLSKDRLLEAVWHNTFVGDDVLVRCISEIRYVFGDDPKSSRVIQTIPKGGYRLIAAVTTEVQADVEPAKSLAAKPETVLDRKSTRLNSSHQIISYAVFFLKKKKEYIS